MYSMKFTDLFLLISVNLLFLHTTSAHHGSNERILLTRPDKPHQIKDAGEYRATFSYYPIGGEGIVDLSVQIENINSGFYCNKAVELQIINPQGVKQTPYSPFIDDEYNFKMRPFLKEKGQYKLIVSIISETIRQEIEFPFVIGQMETDSKFDGNQFNGDICSWCGMLITNNKTVHYLSLNSGEVEKTCCIHCALNAKKRSGNKSTGMETVDFFNDKNIDDDKAWFVKDSNILLEDSMGPYILAFSTVESAKEFQKKYNGSILDFEKLTSEINEGQSQDFESEEIDQLLFLEEFFYNIRKNYYKDMDIKRLVELSIRSVMESLDKESSLKKIEPSSLDFIRGLDRDNTIDDHKIINERVGYIKIRYFGRRTKEDFKKIINDFSAKNIEGLIIDLRGNPGGSLEEAMQIMQYFVPNGNLLASVSARHQQKSYFADTDEKWEYPLAILINENTASSAEVFAASLRYYKRAELIGKSTYGKTSIQQPYPLNSEYTLFLTIGECLLPDGKTVDDSGIKPDHNAEDEAEQMAKALAILENIKTNTMNN